jgi:hypothetical protein
MGQKDWKYNQKGPAGSKQTWSPTSFRKFYAEKIEPKKKKNKGVKRKVWWAEKMAAKKNPPPGPIDPDEELAAQLAAEQMEVEMAKAAANFRFPSPTTPQAAVPPTPVGLDPPLPPPGSQPPSSVGEEEAGEETAGEQEAGGDTSSAEDISVNMLNLNAFRFRSEQQVDQTTCFRANVAWRNRQCIRRKPP